MGYPMKHFAESTLEETALERLGCQRIACGKTDERILALVGEVRVKDVEG